MCVIVSGGGLKCWGRNDFGQLGIGSTSNRHSPLDVPGGVNLVFIVCLCVVRLFFDCGIRAVSVEKNNILELFL